MFQGKSMVFYDYANKRVAIKQLVDVLGHPASFRIVGDYVKVRVLKHRYVIS